MFTETSSSKYALSARQRRLWRIQRPDILRATMSIEIPGHLDSAACKTALEALTQRHEIFRTNFESVPEFALPLQVIGDQRWLQLHDECDVELPAEDTQDLTFGVHLKRCASASRLHIVLPALVADAATLDLVLDALRRCAAGEAPGDAMPSDVVQYPDYAAWLDESLVEPNAKDARLHYFSDLKMGGSFRGAMCDRQGARFLPGRTRLKLAQAAAGAARSAAKVLAVTPSMWVLAIWRAFIRRLDPKTRADVAPMMSGRVLPELAGAAGPMDGYLPLNSGQEPRSVHEWVDDTSVALGRLDALVPALCWDDIDDDAFMPYQFSVRDEWDTAVAALPNRQVLSEPFRLALDIVFAKDGFALSLDHDRGEFSESMARELLRAFERLLAAAAQDFESDLLTVPITEDAISVLQGALALADATRKWVPLSRLIEQQAQRRPDAMAIASAGSMLSYAELDVSANKIARLILAAGAIPGASRAVVSMENPAMGVVAIVALLKVGIAYVPVEMDSKARPEALASKIQACGADLILTDQRHVAASMQTPAVCFLDEDLHDLCDASGVALEEEPQPDWPAYLLFTSGSTGTPKGVLVCQRNLAQYFRMLGAELRVTHEDRWLKTASPIFSSSIRQSLLPLMVGGVVVVPSRDDLRGPSSLIACAERSAVTIVDLVPSLWRRVARSLLAHGRTLPRSVRIALAASEPFSSRVAAQLIQLLPPGATLIQMYGMTETAGIVATSIVDDAALDVDPLPIGRAMSGNVIVAVDASGHLALPGATGELLVAGPTVSSGYVHDSRALRQVFLPVSNDGHLAAYLTGDLGCEMPDARWRLLGRKDLQLKVRGCRVDPAEVERALEGHPSIEQAVVLGVEVGCETQMSACLVARSEVPTRAEIVAYMERRLAAYMVPSRIVFLDAFPTLPSGKVDLAALRGEIIGESNVAITSPASTDVVQRVVRIWQSVLRTAVAPDDDFFALGGDSLSGADVLAEIHDEFGAELSWQLLIESPTARALALGVEQHIGKVAS
jgi:amino acid adenylation domain-containing protein